jgi:subtilase family serine protease
MPCLMPTRRLVGGLALATVLTAVLALAGTAGAAGHDDMPPVVPAGLEADPAFENVTRSTDEMSFTVPLLAVEQEWTGSDEREMTVDDELVASTEEVWPPGEDQQRVDSTEADEGPGTWSPSVGLHSINITVEADGERFELPLPLRIGPDLTAPLDRPGSNVTGVATTPEEPVPGDQVSFEVPIANQGSWDTPAGEPVPVTLTVDGEVVGEATVESVPAGNRTTATFEDVWTAGPGTHQVTVQVAEDAVEEVDAGNNRASTNLTVDQPGVTVAEVTAAPDPAPANATVTVEAVVENPEESRVGEVDVRLHRGGSAVATTTAGPLEPGEQQKLDWTLELDPGMHELVVAPDAEEAPTDPADHPDAAVLELIVGPELAVHDARAEPEAPEAGENVTVNATVSNRGAPFNGSVRVALVDPATGQREDSTAVTDLGAGAHANVTLATAAREDLRSLVVAVDPGGEVPQALGHDDLASVRLAPGTGGAVDVRDLALDPAQPVAGETVRAQATVANAGNDTAEDLAARVFVDGEPVGDDVALDTIEANATVPLEGPGWAGDAGRHTVEVQVGTPGGLDAGAPLARATTTVQVAPPPPTLALHEPQPLAIAQANATLEVTVANEGQAPAAGLAVALVVDGRQLARTPVDALEPGANATVTLAVDDAPANATSAQVAVDGPDGLQLVDEDGDPITGTARPVPLSDAAGPDGDAQSTPAPGPAALLAGLAGLAVAARRRS